MNDGTDSNGTKHNGTKNDKTKDDRREDIRKRIKSARVRKAKQSKSNGGRMPGNSDFTGDVPAGGKVSNSNKHAPAGHWKNSTKKWNEFRSEKEQEEITKRRQTMVDSLGPLVWQIIADTFPKKPPSTPEQEASRVWKTSAFYEAIWIMVMIDKGVITTFPPISDQDVRRTESVLIKNECVPSNFLGALYHLSEREREALFLALMSSGFNWNHVDSYVLGGIYENYLSDFEGNLMLSSLAERGMNLPWNT